MKKMLFLVFALANTVVYAQSKKKQIITLNNRVDSFRLALSNEIKLSNKNRITLNNRVDSFRLALSSEIKLSNENSIELNRRVDSFRLALSKEIKRSNENSFKLNSRVDSFKLALSEKIKNSLNDSDKEEESLSRFFDFKFNYEGVMGINEPNIIPIGLSQNGKVAYIEVHCDGGCGCCNLSLQIYDAKSIEKLDRISVDISEEGDYNSKYITNASSIYNMLYKYKITPFGFGLYSTSNEVSYGRGNNLQVNLNKEKKGFYNIIIKIENKVPVSYKSKKLLFNEDFDIYSSIEYAGHFINPHTDYAIVVLMHRKMGYEGEADYNVEFVAVKIK